ACRAPAGAARPPLLGILADHAGRDLRDRPETAGRDRLPADLAGSVVAEAEAVQRLREPVGPLDQAAANVERQLPLPGDAGPIAARVALAVVFQRSGIVLEYHRAAHPLQSLDRLLQLPLQCVLDRVHRYRPSFGRFVLSDADAAGPDEDRSDSRKNPQGPGGGSFAFLPERHGRRARTPVRSSQG